MLKGRTNNAMKYIQAQVIKYYLHMNDVHQWKKNGPKITSVTKPSVLLSFPKK